MTEEKNKNQPGPQESFYQIYDRIIKRILTLSPNAVVNLINGLFRTDYSPDSNITYNWTEHHDDELTRTIADAILTINHKHAYHIEAQMYKDENIEFRVFDYGYKHALTTRGGTDVLNFPEPQIIYLYSDANLPDEKIIRLNFGTQGTFDYHVPIYKLIEHSPQELDEQNMIILIPFALLRLRKQLEKSRSIKDIKALKSLIIDDILRLIRKNLQAGNITAADANELRGMTLTLYKYLYARYEEIEKEGLITMMENRLVLESDLLEMEITERVTERVTAEITDKITAEVTDKITAEVTDKVTAEVTDKVTAEVTDRVTAEVTDKVTAEVTDRVTAKEQLAVIRKLHSKLKDSKQVASLLDLPLETVLEAI